MYWTISWGDFSRWASASGISKVNSSSIARITSTISRLSRPNSFPRSDSRVSWKERVNLAQFHVTYLLGIDLVVETENQQNPVLDHWLWQWGSMAEWSNSGDSKCRLLDYGIKAWCTKYCRVCTQLNHKGYKLVLQWQYSLQRRKCGLNARCSWWICSFCKEKHWWHAV